MDDHFGVQPPATVTVEWDDKSAILLAYRMGQVEANLTRMNKRFDMFVENYPNAITLELMLKPLKEKVEDLETKEAERISQSKTQTAQWRLAMIMALVSPTAVIIVNNLMGSK